VPSQAPLQPLEKPVTVRTIEQMASRGERFAALTCYDATTARWLQEAGIPMLLVGDTAAEMILGLPSTIHAPLEFMITITAAVRRGAPKCLVMADMPFMSYQADVAEAMRNAGRFMTEGMADAVKLEVDRSHVPLVERMASAGVPTVPHLGLRPQQVKREGGYRAAGRTHAAARELVAAAVEFEQAGATMILLEAMPAEVSEQIVKKTNVPVISCGAGPACHGQIVVLQDILGMTERQPPFAPALAPVGEAVARAAATWRDRVQRGDLGDHPYRMADEAVNTRGSESE